MCGKNCTPATKRRARLAYLKRHTPKCQASGVRHSPHTIHNYQKPSALHILQRPLWPSPMIPLSPFPLQGRHCTTSHSISTQFQQPRSSLPTNPTHPNLTTPVPILPHSSSQKSNNPSRTTPRPPPLLKPPHLPSSNPGEYHHRPSQSQRHVSLRRKCDRRNSSST